MPEIAPIHLAGDMLVPVSDDHVARLAEIEAIRGLTQQVSRLGGSVDHLTEKVSLMHTDIEVMKTREEQVQELRQIVYHNRDRVEKLELKEAEARGAGKFLTMVKDFSPWVMSLIFGVLIMLGIKVHL